MKKLPELFERNRQWAARVDAETPGFFESLSRQQAPKYLWIGCADSRVPATQIVDLPPGEIFVHRNVANVVVHSDFNCLSTIQFSVEVLKVEHIIVVGHYGCGGVGAVLDGKEHGLVDNWVGHVRDVLENHRDEIAAIPDQAARLDRLCELNVIAQATNVCRGTVVRSAWQRGRPLTVHGWIYGLRDGLIRDLGFCVSAEDEIP